MYCNGVATEVERTHPSCCGPVFSVGVGLSGTHSISVLQYDAVHTFYCYYSVRPTPVHTTVRAHLSRASHVYCTLCLFVYGVMT